MNEVVFDGVVLTHEGDYLYADGVEWSLIGSTDRPSTDLISIYLKYKQG